MVEATYYLGACVLLGNGIFEDRRWIFLGAEPQEGGLFTLRFTYQRSEGMGYANGGIVQTVKPGSVLRLADGLRMHADKKKIPVNQLTVLDIAQDMVQLRGKLIDNR